MPIFKLPRLHWVLVVGVLISCYLSPSTVQAQKSQGIGTNAPNPRAILDLTVEQPVTYPQGLLLPRLTTAQRNSLATVAGLPAGMAVFDSNDLKFYIWSGSWVAAGSSNITTITGTNIASVTTITGGYNIDVPYISIVGINGLTVTSAGASFSISGQNIVSSQWTTTGNNIYYDKGNVSIGTTATGAALSILQDAGVKPALQLLGGATKSVFLELGRGSTDATIGVAGNASTISGLASPGDFVIKSNTIGSNLILAAKNTGGNILFSTGLADNLSLFINTAGNIGIGTTSPGATFDVNGNARIRNLSISGSVVTVDGLGNLGMGTVSASQWTTTTTGIYYNANNVGIGTNSNAAYRLNVLDNTNANAVHINNLTNYASSALYAEINNNSNSGNPTAIRAYVNSSTNGAVTGVDASVDGSTAGQLIGFNTNITSNTTAIKYGLRIGINGTGPSSIGIDASVYGATTNYAIKGYTQGGYGVYGQSQGNSAINYGLYGMSDGGGTATNYALYADALNGTTNWAGYFNGGNVFIKNMLGLGTSVPGAVLDVKGTVRFESLSVTGSVLTVDGLGNVGMGVISSSTPSWQLGGNSIAGALSTILGTTSNSPIGFYTNGAERMTINEFGRIGVGGPASNFSVEIVAAPSGGLRVSGNPSVTPIAQFLNTGGGNSSALDAQSQNSGSTIKATNTNSIGFAGNFIVNNINSTGAAMIVNNNSTTSGRALDVIGNIRFTTYTIPGAVLTVDGLGNLGMGSISGGASQWTTSGNNIFYKGGNVGIGTTIPGASLEINSGTLPGIFAISSASNQAGTIQATTTGLNSAAIAGFGNGTTVVGVYGEMNGTAGFAIEGVVKTNGTAIGAQVNAGSGNAGFFTIGSTTSTGAAIIAQTNGLGDAASFSVNNPLNSFAGVYMSTIGTGPAAVVSVINPFHTGSALAVSTNSTILGAVALDVTGKVKLESYTVSGSVLTVDGIGNVGMGTISLSPSWQLGGNAVGTVKAFGTTDANDLPFITNNVERMRISSGANGYVGINNSAPASALDIIGYNGGPALNVQAFASGGSPYAIRASNNSSSVLFTIQSFNTVSGGGAALFSNSNVSSGINNAVVKIIASSTIPGYVALEVQGGIKFSNLNTSGSVLTVDGAGNVGMATLSSSQWITTTLGIYTNSVVGIGVTTFSGFEALRIGSNNGTRGFIPPYITTVQMVALTSLGLSMKDQGALYWNTDIKDVSIWDGTQWQNKSNNNNNNSIDNTSWNIYGSNSISGSGMSVAGFGVIGTYDSYGLKFRTNNLDRMFINSIGGISIGNNFLNNGSSSQIMIGASNIASGTGNYILGELNSITGNAGLALGFQVHSAHLGAALIGDWSSNAPTYTQSSQNDQMTMRFDGGYRLYSDKTLGNKGLFITKTNTGINVQTPIAALQVSGDVGIGDGSNVNNGAITIWLKNVSGSARVQGEILIVSTLAGAGNDDSFDVTQMAGNNAVVGVLYENCANGNTCRVAISGVVSVIADVSTVRGQHVITGSVVSGRAGSTPIPSTGASIGVWLQDAIGAGSKGRVLLR